MKGNSLRGGARFMRDECAPARHPVVPGLKYIDGKRSGMRGSGSEVTKSNNLQVFS